MYDVYTSVDIIQNCEMKIVITGANLKNNGSQSMLYVTVCELRKRFDNCEIYFGSLETSYTNFYLFDSVYFSDSAKQIALKPKSFKTKLTAYIKEIARIILKRTNNLSRIFELVNLLPTVDIIIDISGFCYGSKWSVKHQEKHLDCIRLAKKYNIPIILMPQSFGPFDYNEATKFLMQDFQELFRYPDIIYTRENEGYELLYNLFGLRNVEKSADLVLQNPSINTNLIFKHHMEINLPEFCTSNAVAIVPNSKCFMHGKNTNILDKYKIIIDVLLAANKEIYIFKHAIEDSGVCRMIYNLNKTNSHVHLLEKNFSCIEYDRLVNKFQFIVCSRFHGIVHAYKHAIPCIVLGWAVKYTELADMVSQRQYVFNITDPSIDDEMLKGLTIRMLHNYPLETKIISEKIVEIQKNNCFDCLDKYPESTHTNDGRNKIHTEGNYGK